MTTQNKRARSALITLIAGILAFASIWVGVWLIQASAADKMKDHEVLFFWVAHAVVVAIAVTLIVRAGKKLENQ